MKPLFVSLMLACAVASAAYADHPSLAFYVVKTEDLKRLLPEGKSPGQLDVSRLSDIAVAQGHSGGSCSIYLKTKEYQYHIRATLKAKQLSYSLSAFSQETRQDVFSCSGDLKFPAAFDVPCQKPDWRNEEYAVVWCLANLKQ